MSLIKQFWQLAKPYWCDRKHWVSWVLLALCITAFLSVVEITVWLNEWNKKFYDALAAVDIDNIYPLLIEFCWIIALVVVLTVYGKWLQQLVVIRWRTWLTEQLISRWFQDKAYYRMTLTSEPDNPDQRIAEDARLLAADSVDLFVGAIQSIAVLLAFTTILWELSGQLKFEWNGDTIQIAGYLFWVALIYCVLGTLVTHFFGHQLHKLNFNQQRKEANFRASLLRKRDAAEQIALFNGEAVEQQQLKQSFNDIAHNWYALMNREKKLGFVVNTYHKIAMMVPLFAGIPALMAKTITIGGLFQVRMAFMKVYSAFSWFVHHYDDLTRWSATVVRLSHFMSEIDKQSQLNVIARNQQLATHDLAICKPNGEPLLNALDLNLPVASQLFISGASGLGKSTLLRTLSGIWPFYKGEFNQQYGFTLLLPQKPYLPTGSLRDCLSYPSEQTYDEALIVNALTAVGLPEFADELDKETEWQLKLSGGEQQRLSLARALLNQPDTLILDEATSSLDEASAQAMIKMLKHQLPTTTLLMVSHQQSLQHLFERKLDLNRYRSTASSTAGVTPCV